MVSLIKPSLWTLILGVFVMCANAQTLTWYVSPEGKDTWSGQQAAPNQEGPYLAKSFGESSTKSSTEEGNILTEEQQWAKIALVKSIAESVC